MWVPLSKSTNVSTFHLAPGYTKYHAFCAEADLDDKEDYNDPMCHVAEITDDEDSDDDDHGITSDQEPPIIQPQRLENKSPQGRNEQLPNTPMTFDLDLNKHTSQEESEPTTIQDDEEEQATIQCGSRVPQISHQVWTLLAQEQYRLWQGKVCYPSGWRHATFQYAQHASYGKAN